ncbi:hypothetical protein [Aquimarina agarilytica]|uniref:hypothetical protein n=1 Tax=Aquimarina agarilytica TaxID=1087449 RepID=UPI00028A37C4|nr:hypothetical protein [Aquimarina agarilytica]
MNKIKLLLLISSLLLLISCDQFYCVQYTINNTSNNDIIVKFYDKEYNLDSNTVTLKSKQQFIIYEDFGSGETSNSFLKKISSITLDSLSIRNTTNKHYRLNSKQINLWIKKKQTKNDTCASLELIVTNTDFN